MVRRRSSRAWEALAAAALLNAGAVLVLDRVVPAMGRLSWPTAAAPAPPVPTAPSLTSAGLQGFGVTEYALT